MLWDRVRCAQAIATLGQSSSVLEAAAKLGITGRALNYGLHGAGFSSASTWLPGAKGQAMPGPTPAPDASIPTTIAPPADPIEVERAKKRMQMLSSERAELVQRVADAEDRARFLHGLRDTACPAVVVPRERASGTREATAIALLSDLHVEEVVRSEAVGGRNEYNLQIAGERLRRFFEAFAWQIKFHRERWAVRDALLWCGGDWLTGYIHEELIETNDLGPLETVLWLKANMKAGIRYLLQDPGIERLTLPCNPGNHGRMTKRTHVKTITENSFEWLLYNVLAEDFADEPRVQFIIPRSAHTYVQAYDWTLHFHHGDEVRYWGGVGGLSIPLGKRVPMWDKVKPAHYHHIGHFHTLRDLGHTLCNGSLIGYSEYAMAIGAEYEPPQQGFYMLDKARGKTSVSPLWVSERQGTT